MKQTIIAKIKLHTTPDQFKALRSTQLAYRDALNYVSQYAFEHGKMSNKVALQEGTYTELRTRYRIPAQMACSIPRQVGATYKALWAKVKQNTVLRETGKTKKRYKGLDQAPRFLSPTLTYQFGHDYSLKKDQHVSISSLEGRVIIPYTGYNKHVAMIQQGAKFGTAQLWYDKPKKCFYLLVSLEIEKPNPTPETHKGVVGVDVGQRYLAVTTTMKGNAVFYSGKQIQAKADHYARLRKRLQKKGTRSATRHLITTSKRERQLKQDCNHVLSRRIIDQYPNSIIGLENLTHIRERIGKRHQEKATQRQRKNNRHASSWSFAELHSYIAYKALLAGSMTIQVDAHYTSQACPMCGYTSDMNRPNHGLLFVCQACHYTLHADLIGARNVALRTMLVRQDWTSTGVLSARPDVSRVEAKAERLQRYSELRWNVDTNPPPLSAGDN